MVRRPEGLQGGEIRILRELLVRALVLALLLGGGWLVLQYYTEAELVAAARRFWGWWSTLLSGELGRYWNPIGAGASLALMLTFLLRPITRLFRSRRYSDRSYDSGGGDGDGDGD